MPPNTIGQRVGSCTVPRVVRLIFARIRCHFYLLFKGMWRGECEFCAYDKGGKLVFVAAVTGTMQPWTLKITRQFWNDGALKSNPKVRLDPQDGGSK